MSANGSARGAARDRVLERALDVVERLGEHDRAAVHLGVEAGLGGELGQPVDGDVHLHRAAARSSSARCRSTKSAGSSRAVDALQERDLRVRRGDHDVGAAAPRPTRASTTPVAGPSRTSMRATAASVRTVDAERRAPRRAAPAVTAPMPPSGKPHEPSWPSPTSPILWCAITYAVPGERGPAQVPMTPLTDEHAVHRGDSKYSSSRSAMLIVNSRVTSAAPRASTPAQRRSERRPGRAGRRAARAELAAGSSVSSGPSTSARPSEPGVPAVDRVGVRRRELARSARGARAVVVGQLQVAAVRTGREVRALRVHLVAVAVELEVAHDRRRHQATRRTRAPSPCSRGRTAAR